MDGEITAETLQSIIENGADVRLVDIRSPESFEQGHIPGSDNIPFEELPQRVEELDGEDRIITICPLGKSSIQAARLIASYEGTSEATVESLDGGLREWEQTLEESKRPTDETNRDVRPR